MILRGHPLASGEETGSCLVTTDKQIHKRFYFPQIQYIPGCKKCLTINGLLLSFSCNQEVIIRRLLLVTLIYCLIYVITPRRGGTKPGPVDQWSISRSPAHSLHISRPELLHSDSGCCQQTPATRLRAGQLFCIHLQFPAQLSNFKVILQYHTPW